MTTGICPIDLPAVVLIFRAGAPPQYVAWPLLDPHRPAPARHPSAWARTLEEARAAAACAPPLSPCPLERVDDFLRPSPASFAPAGYVGLCQHGELVEAWALPGRVG